MLNRKPYNNQDKNEKRHEAVPKENKMQNVKAYNPMTGFTSYLTCEYAEKLEEQKAIFSGVLKVNPTGYSNGSVETKIGNVIISNRESLNRAYNGNKVMVEIISQSKKQESICNWKINNVQEEDNSVSVDYTSLTGHIVYAEPEYPIRLECFYCPEHSKGWQLSFIPIDRRYPCIDVVTETNDGFLQNCTYFVEIKDWMPEMKYPGGQLIGKGREMKLDNLDEICEYVMLRGGMEWNYHSSDSLDEEIVEYIKEEEDSLCSDVGLPRSEVFDTDQQVLDDIERQIEYLKSRENVFEQQNRKNFTDELVFTIDPDTAKDFDDACHISIISHENTVISFKEFAYLSEEKEEEILKFALGYEIGVHIADVTHYVKQDSILDRNARRTTTSVYITDRCCPMLPYELADGLCSLNPGVPRYCFSVVFRISKEGKLLPQTVEFTKSVILSHARLDYVAAQKMISKQVIPDNLSTLFDEEWPVAKGYEAAIVLAVEHMNRISKEFREQRNSLGALQMDSYELRWRVNQNMEASILPPEEANDAHHLIEEFMISANCLVAMRLVQTFPGCQISRSHPPPMDNEEINERLQRKGFCQLNITSGETLVKSINTLSGEMQKRFAFDTEFWSSECQAMELSDACFVANNLMRANYMCGLSENQVLFNHWGIHAQLYMHFTSPIRRYADDICHRMLEASLLAEKSEQPSNITKNCLKFAEETSLYTADCLPPVSFLRECDRLNPISDKAEPFMREAQNGDLLEEIEAGKKVDLQGQKKAAALQKSIEYLLNYDMRRSDCERPEDAAQESGDFDAVKALLLKYAGVSLEDLKTAIDDCNQHAKDAASIESIHHQIMFGLMLRDKGDIETTGFLVKAKQNPPTSSIFVPYINEFFACGNECECLENGKVKIKNWTEGLPFNRQNNEISDNFVELDFLAPIKMKISAAKLVCDGVELDIVDLKVQEEEIAE